MAPRSTSQELELNRLSIPPASTGGSEATQTKSYDLQSQDRYWLPSLSASLFPFIPLPPTISSFVRFWQTQRGSPFPTVAEAVQTELAEYRAKEEEVTKLKSVMVSAVLPLTAVT